MSLLGYRVNEGEEIPWTAIKGRKVARHIAVNELGELIAAASPTTLAKLEELIAQAIQIEINTDAINLNVDELEERLGGLDDPIVVDPSASGSLNSLVKGVLQEIINLATTTTSGITLSNPGESSFVFNTQNFSDHSFNFTVNNINTDVTVRAEGSNDGTNFTNIDALGEDSVYTTNGYKLLTKSNFSIRFLRLTMVAESGGTDVTIQNITYTGR